MEHLSPSEHQHINIHHRPSPLRHSPCLILGRDGEQDRRLCVNKGKTAETTCHPRNSLSSSQEPDRLNICMGRHQKKIYNAAKTSKALTLQQPDPANTFTQRTGHTSEVPRVPIKTLRGFRVLPLPPAAWGARLWTRRREVPPFPSPLQGCLLTLPTCYHP